jgi:uncharacterized protein (DUF433 family)
MEDEEWDDFTEWIQVDPRVLSGKPAIRNTRIPVSMVLNLIAHGESFEKIIHDYPTLSKESIRAALLWAGRRLDRKEVLPQTIR